jgi:hypothetical protein
MELINPQRYISAPNHLHAFLRSWIDHETGMCYIDGIRVYAGLYSAFNQQWSTWYHKKYGEKGSEHRCTGWCWMHVVNEMN